MYDILYRTVWYVAFCLPTSVLVGYLCYRRGWQTGYDTGYRAASEFKEHWRDDDNTPETRIKFRRAAFTLVELLVVMGIILILAAFVVAFFPSAASSAREARAGQALQAWLNVAKQRAMRDQAPRGLRLWIRNPDLNGSTAVYQLPEWTAGQNYAQLDGVVRNGIGYRCIQAHTAAAANAPAGIGNLQWRQIQLVTDCQYIEQPEDVAGGAGRAASMPFVTADPRTPWSAATSYPMFTNVMRKDVDTAHLAATGETRERWYIFYSRQQPNIGRDPRTNPAFWVKDQMIVNFSADDLTNGHGVAQNPLALNPPINPTTETSMKYWTVQPGDYFEHRGTGVQHRIHTIFPFNVGQLAPFTYSANSLPNRMAITPPVMPPELLPSMIGGTPTAWFSDATANYRISRRPRTVGDETLKMPADTFIDLDTNAVFGNSLPSPNAAIEGSGFYDILFAPNGTVMSRGLTTANIHLWVRSAVQDQPSNPYRGDPTLISVFAKTGLVGAYPPDPNLTNGTPYGLVK